MATQTNIEVPATERGFASVTIGEKQEEMKNAEAIDYSDLVADLRQSFMLGKTKDLGWRKQQLKQLQLMVKENVEVFTEGFRKDHSGPKIRALFELFPYVEAGEAISSLNGWAAHVQVPHRGANPLERLNGKSYIRKEPKGVVLVICPWNLPIGLVLQCMIPVIAAGNCCVVKPSEVSANSCSVLARLIPKYFDQSCIRVVTGGVAETTALLREKYDHIFYTGNGAVARIVMAAAAKHLTPCTLELGGKSPTYVDKSAKIDVAIERINAGKWLNAGQVCIAPDYILVHKDVAATFKKKLRAWVNSAYGATASERKSNPALGRIINGRHVQRVSSLVKATTGKIVEGGECNVNDHYHAPTIIEEPGMNDTIMQEEIFGPVLPIIEVDSVQDAVVKVNQICTHPLALYIYAQNQSTIDYFLDNTASGGVAVNSCMEHAMNNYLPFGGVGESGMGSYHGAYGFNEFSHHRSVFVKDTVLNKGSLLGPPPYPDSLFDIAVKLTITGFFTDAQRKKIKLSAMAVLLLIGYIAARKR